MSKIKDNNYRVDFIAIHWYAPPNADSFLKLIDDLYNMYQLPIWITEFAPQTVSSAQDIESTMKCLKNYV